MTEVARQLAQRDDAVEAEPPTDAQLAAIRDARRSSEAARASREAAPAHGSAAGPLIGVKLHVLTCKTLGGLHTDLNARDAAGRPVPGLYAAGEVAGFGGGGMHGYRALEGTFLGGCLFSGRVAGRAAGAATA